MDRRTLVGGGVGAVVLLLVLVVVVLDIPVVTLLSAMLGGSSGPQVAENATGFEHVGEGPHDFQAGVNNLTECGSTCRNLTATLQYVGDGTAEDVRLDMRVLVQGERLWRGNQTVASLDSGGTYDIVQEVELGFSGAGKVLQNDGNVTARIVVHHAGDSETLEKVLQAA